MSPQAGFVLLNEVAPRLKAVIPHIKPVGAEDTEELMQDALAVAAKMLHDLEQRNKTVTPGNIVYFTMLHMRSGRRSYSAGRTDIMGSGTQLDGKSCVLSMEEEVGYDPELDEPITLEQLLEGHHDDPAMAASRNIDWELFLASHDYRYGLIVKGIVQGRNLVSIAKSCRSGYSRVYQLRNQLAEDLREFMGATAVEDAARIPSWSGNLMVDKEKTACRADRRHQ